MFNSVNFDLCIHVVILVSSSIVNRGNFHLRPQVLSPGAKRLRCGMAPLTAEADKHDEPPVHLDQADGRPHY